MPPSRNSQIRLVGQKIRQIRKSRHLTQSDVATQIGVTQSDLSRMESGEYKVGLDTLFRILQFFELSMSQFFGEPVAAEVPPAPTAFSGDPDLARDWEALSTDAQREVREFVAFKKLQTEFRRSLSPPEPPHPAPPRPEPENLVSFGNDEEEPED